MDSAIGVPVERVDHWEKADGRAVYVGDMRPDGMLFAKTLRSERPRARIREVALPPLPEGYTVVDHRDLPGKNRVKILLDDQPFFAEGAVNYVGEPILLVVGPEKETIQRLLRGIRVEYEDLPPVLTMADAENPALEPIYGERHWFVEYKIGHGDVDSCFARAERIFTGEYRTGYQEHLYLEPQGVLAIYADGRITVYGSIQCPYYVKNALMQAFGWDGGRVRVVQTTLGGAFGGKEDYPSLLAGQAAAAAYKTGRPVQLLLERGEDLEVTTKRHPSLIRIRTAIGPDDRLVALEVEILLNAGAYAGLSSVVLQRSLFNISNVYNLPNLRAGGRIIATNTVPTGAFRGFGAPQTIFAIETHLDTVAKKLGADPLAFKEKHLVKKGDLTVTGGIHRQEIILPELIAAVDRLSGYREKIRAYARGEGGPGRGIGLALFLHGGGFTGSGERDHIKAVVRLCRRADSRVEILVANTEMGQGLRTTLRKIVAKVLALPLAQVVYENPDTDRVPDSGPTVASRSVMIVGRLVQQAAVKLREKWEQPGAIEVTEHYRHPEDMRWDDGKFAGDAYPAYSWGVCAVEVTLDPLTCEIVLQGVWSAFDVGRAIDERIIRGQIEGGLLQGLGYGSIEVLEGMGGRLQQRSVTDYAIPTSLDGVKIEHVLVDNPYADGPFGAKGAGELTLIGAAPALAAAVGNALGVAIDRLPITPEYLLELVRDGRPD